MVFNWFRRPAAQDSSAQPQEPAAPTLEAPTTPAESSKPDYLAWAKAAYAHMQQQVHGDTLPTAAPAEPERAATTELPPPVAAAAAEVPSVSPPESASFLAQAAALREERRAALQAQLAASARPAEAPPPIAMPDAVHGEVPAATGEDVPTFDEGFLWSAEVLATQGRRPEDVSPEEITWLQKLRRGLGKTQRAFVNQLKAVVGQGPLNAQAVEDIEALLLQADVGVQATDQIISQLQARIRQEALPSDQAVQYLKSLLREILETPYHQGYTPQFTPRKDTLNIWLITGVNGAGKTTTIGKVAHLAQKSGYRCLIAAADTFRAAAVEQVSVWGQRSGVEVIANPSPNADPAAVVFDAITAAQARSTELLLVDTAGRLQNKQNLMEELGKIRRIVDRKAAGAQVEALLVLDATLGQNGLRQAEVFTQVAKLSGIVLTKLDGTAKGGIALAITQQLGLPIRFIGAGEGIEDLRPFSSYEFVEALLT